MNLGRILSILLLCFISNSSFTQDTCKFEFWHYDCITAGDTYKMGIYNFGGLTRGEIKYFRKNTDLTIDKDIVISKSFFCQELSNVLFIKKKYLATIAIYGPMEGSISLEFIYMKSK